MAKPIDLLNNPRIIAELDTFPNQATIWEILNSTDHNQVWKLPEGRAVMLIEHESEDPFIFVAGELNMKDVESIIKICPTGFPMVYCNPQYHHLFLSKGWDFHLRIELSYKHSQSQLPLRDNIWKLKPINNMELFEQCFWFKKMLKKYPSPQVLFDSSKAYVLCMNDKVVTEAYIDIDYKHRHAEISVATNPDFREQGAGTLITSYMIEICLESKLIPIWSCQVDNRPSLKTALKAGFNIDRYYVQMVPECGNTLSPILEKWINESTPLNWNPLKP